jgi:hypothetical protein
MIVEVSEPEQMKKILTQLDTKKYVCYYIPMKALYFRPNVTTKGRDTYKFTDVSLQTLQMIKTIWGEENIIIINNMYPEDRFA